MLGISVYVKHAESLFYPSVDKFDALINSANAQGNDDLARTYTEQESLYEGHATRRLDANLLRSVSAPTGDDRLLAGRPARIRRV